MVIQFFVRPYKPSRWNPTSFFFMFPVVSFVIVLLMSTLAPFLSQAFISFSCTPLTSHWLLDRILDHYILGSPFELVLLFIVYLPPCIQPHPMMFSSGSTLIYPSQFCFILIRSNLFYFLSLCFVLFYFDLFWFALLQFILFWFILFWFISPSSRRRLRRGRRLHQCRRRRVQSSVGEDGKRR